MKYTFLIFSFLFLILIRQGNANPFAAKIQESTKPKKEKTAEKIIFKGFISIGSAHYGLIRIGRSDFEVLEGDTIRGYHIRKVSCDRLDYSVNNKKKYLLLDSN